MENVHYSRYLKTNHADLALDLVLRSPITILNGVGSQAGGALKPLDIHTVYDLAKSRIFNNARSLVLPSEGEGLYGEFKLVPADVIDHDILATDAQIDWKTQPIARLRGIGPNNASFIEQHLSVTTIRDLALWPPFLAARQIAGIADKQEAPFVDQEIPQELVPKFNEYASEKCFYSVYVIDEDAKRAENELRQAIALEKHLRLESSDMPRTGAILRYEQSWTPVALTLGNLLHSLALAPGESTRIAIIDWTRRQGVRTTEDISQLEALSNTLMQTRSISEVTRAVAREAQSGFSNMNSNSTVSNNAYSSYGLQNGDQVMSAVAAGAAGGASAGAVAGGLAGVGIGGASGVVIGGTLGSGAFSVPGAIAGGLIGAGAGGLVGVGAGGLIGGTAGGVGAFLSTAEFGAGQGSSSSTEVDVVTTTSSSGSREVEAEMAQNIDDRTHQHSSSSRDKHASIVQEVSQQETEQISTRVVTNYNHMHALTIQYFEVVQVYNIRTTLVQNQACLYIPFLPIQWNQDLIRLYRQQILRAALTADVAYTLLSSEKTVLLASPTYPRIPDNIKQQRLTNAQYAEQLTKARSLLNKFVSANPLDAWQFPDHFMISFAFGTMMNGGAGPFGGLGNDYQLKYELIFHYRDGRRRVINQQEMDFSGLTIGSISRVSYELTATNPGHWNFADALAEPQYHTMTLVLQQSQDAHWESDKETISYTVHYAVDATQIAGHKLIIPLLTFSRAMVMVDLIDHLNENTEYYTGKILRRQSNPLVRQILNHYSFNGKRLINQVDQEPVAISGNSLVFLLHEDEAKAAEGGKKRASARYRAGSVSKNSLVPIATGGVFAEAVQGRANAAEKLDISRFWNWHESPIPIVAPEIAPIQSGSRATSADVRPGSLEAPLVQYVTPNALPAPQSMPAILQTVSTQMFRDMSGIAQTAQLAQKALEEAMEGATTTGEQASEGLKQGLGFTKDLLGKVIDRIASSLTCWSTAACKRSVSPPANRLTSATAARRTPASSRIGVNSSIRRMQTSSLPARLARAGAGVKTHPRKVARAICRLGLPATHPLKLSGRLTLLRYHKGRISLRRLKMP